MDTSKMNKNDHYERNQFDHVLSDEQIKMLVERKADFLAGRTTSIPWNEIKKKYVRNRDIK